MPKHTTEAAYETLTALGVPSHPQWWDNAYTFTHGDSYYGTESIGIEDLPDELARKILTQHALDELGGALKPHVEWWFIENEYGKIGVDSGWVIRTLPKQQVRRKDYYGEDLLDAIVEAWKAVGNDT